MAMSPSQATLVATVETYEHLQDNLHRWFFAEPTELLFQRLAEFDHDLQTTSEVIPLAKVLLPPVRKVKFKQLNWQRDLAMLRCIEAIRFFAAGHHDQLPERLSEIKEVLIPDDPMTGQSFSYELNGGRALITSPAAPGEPAAQGLRWEIQLAEKGK